MWKFEKDSVAGDWVYYPIDDENSDGIVDEKDVEVVEKKKKKKSKKNSS